MNAYARVNDFHDIVNGYSGWIRNSQTISDWDDLDPVLNPENFIDVSWHHYAHIRGCFNSLSLFYKGGSK